MSRKDASMGHSTASTSKNRQKWEAADRETIGSLDLRKEYAALGVRFAADEPNAAGWVSCHAIDREDATPSAAVNVHTGRYKDHGGQGASLNLWEFAAAHGPYADWREARADYARKARVTLPKGRPPADPTEHLEFRPWNEALVGLWCLKKTGVTPEAVQAAGGRLARYRQQFNVIALPVFGSRLTEADPVGWVMFQTNGGPLPVFRKGEAPAWKKMKLTAGSEPGLLGAHALARTGDHSDPAGQVIWLVEGPSDMLALYAAIPPELRETNLVICNANGANEIPKTSMLTPFAARQVRVIRDADAAGEAGAERWTNWLIGSAAEVRRVRLPYPITPDHGKDLRDWLNEGHTFAELEQLAADAVSLTSPDPQAGGTEGPKPVEADDDPHRLARLYLAQHASHPDFGATLHLWKKEWWRWGPDAGCYRVIENELIQGEITTLAKSEFDRLNLEAQQLALDGDELPKAAKVTRHLVGNIAGAVMASCVHRTALVDEQPTWLIPTDHSRNCIAVTNGIVDLDWLLAGRDDFLTPHTPAWFSSVRLPYAFDADADCPRWKETLQRNLEGDTDRIALLQEWAGYLLTPDTSHQTFLVLEGEGANGKSVYLAGVTAMLGHASVSNVSLEAFGQRFQLTATLRKLANIAADCGELDKVSEDHLKRFTSGDRMSFDRKGLPAIDATPTARMMMACNTRPRFCDRTDGIWRRMLLVPFRIKIPNEDRIRGMDKYEWWEASGELPGIFNWAVAGLHRLRQQGSFTAPRICQDALDDYRLESNPAKEFLLESCEENSLGETSTVLLYDAYKKWCGENGYRPLGERQFGKEVRRAFPRSERRNLGSRSGREYKYTRLLMKNQSLD